MEKIEELTNNPDELTNYLSRKSSDKDWKKV